MTRKRRNHAKEKAMTTQTTKLEARIAHKRQTAVNYLQSYLATEMEMYYRAGWELIDALCYDVETRQLAPREHAKYLLETIRVYS
jgi:hypothetical protein